MRVYHVIATSFEGVHNITGKIGGKPIHYRIKSVFMWYWGPIFLN